MFNTIQNESTNGSQELVRRHGVIPKHKVSPYVNKNKVRSNNLYATY